MGRARPEGCVYYVTTWRQDATVETFLESGEEEYKKLVEPVWDGFQFAPQGVPMLEVGCGAGRMTGSFARRFAAVYGLDTSEEMQNLAKQNLAGCRNIHRVLGEGTNLSAIPSDSVDFVFSYFLLQHLPTEDLVLTYMREMLRMLKQAGIFFVSVQWRKDASDELGRLAWGAVDARWALNLKKLSQATARWLCFDPATAGKSGRGTSLRGLKVVEILRAAGGSGVQITGDETAMAWFRGRKSVSAAR